ncbi:hypothetical protein CsSME_00038703 [Camellia sinensis var. sinensis]
MVFIALLHLCTIPLDTAKVRLQLQKNALLLLQGKNAYLLYEKELFQDYIFNKFYVGDNFVGDVPLSKKILAALTTGEVMCHCNHSSKSY